MSLQSLIFFMLFQYKLSLTKEKLFPKTYLKNSVFLSKYEQIKKLDSFIVIFFEWFFLALLFFIFLKSQKQQKPKWLFWVLVL